MVHRSAAQQEWPRLFGAAERETLGQELARLDLDVPPLEIIGERYHRVLRRATTSSSVVDLVRVERSLYRQGHGSDYAVCPVELRAWIIEGY
jgi:hypothetical protein